MKSEVFRILGGYIQSRSVRMFTRNLLRFRWRLGCFLFGICMLLFSSVYGAPPDGIARPREVTGTYVIRVNDCGTPDYHGERNTHVVMDHKTFKETPIDVHGVDMKNIKLGSEVRVRGSMKMKNVGRNRSFPKEYLEATSIEMAEGADAGDAESTTEEGTLSVAASGEEPPPPIESAATLIDLPALLIFANTSDYTVDQGTIDTVKDLMFGPGDNVGVAMSKASYGHFRLVEGATITVDLTHLTASATESTAMRTEMISAANALGYNTDGSTPPYSRILFFCPQGTLKDGRSNWTAWAYVVNGGYWAHSVYSYRWTTGFFDGFLHELGHNFGLMHSSEGSDEYGDETCLMGRSHSYSSKTRYGTYNGVKKMTRGWFDAWPGTETNLTSDATLDLVPMAILPDVTAGVRLVRFAGTTWYVSYARNIQQHGMIGGNDATTKSDKVIVHEAASVDANSYEYSYLRSAISEGGTYNAGTTVIKFERYGDAGKNYVTVSFDLADGNAKPVANAQTVSVFNNVPQAITLSGSDADGDTLTFAVVTNPTHGTLSGTAPNLTYTANSGYIGSDSFVFSVNDGKISSFATVSLTVVEPNIPPVADNQSLNVYFNTPRTVTLTATDEDGDAITYSIDSQPAQGTLSGTLPNLTYTPNLAYVGADSFTFKANDGMDDSNVATVSLSVLGTSNSPPVVFAGLDKSAPLSVVDVLWTPAELSTEAWYDASDASTLTLTASNTVSQWNDKSGNGRHVMQSTASQHPSYVGNSSVNFDGVDDILFNDKPFMYANGSVDIYVAAAIAGTVTGRRLISETSSSSDNPVYLPLQTRNDADPTQMRAFVRNDANSIIFDQNQSLSATGAFNLSNRKIYQVRDTGSQMSGRVNGGSATAVNYTRSGTLTMNSFGIGGIAPRPNSITGSFWLQANVNEIIVVPSLLPEADREKLEGYLAHKWGLTANLPVGHPYKAAAPISSAPGAQVVLDDASVSDPNNDPLTAAWTEVSQPEGSTVTFADANLVNATATFDTVGVYTLRLTASDGSDTASDTVNITVTDGSGPPCTVTYNGNVNTGGSTPVDVLSPYESGATVVVLGAGDMVKTGHTFANWNTQTNGTGTGYAPAATFTITSNTTLYAQWTLIPVSVITDTGTVNVPEGGTETFQVKLSDQPSGGVIVTVAHTAGDTDITVQSGGTLNFTTANWDTYQTVTLAAANDADADNGTATITCTPDDVNYLPAEVTAIEIDKDTTFTVTSDGNGTTAPSGAVVVEKGVATAIAATANEGYNFANWAVTAGTATIADTNAAYTTATIAAPATVQANFVLKTYTVSYNANEADTGAAPSAQTKTHGINLPLATNSGNLIRTGYSFSGWNTQANGLGADYAAGAIYTGNADLTLYAKWDLDAPAAPTGLVVTNVSLGQVGLSWEAVPFADSYHVKRATTSGGPYAFVDTTTATNYSDSVPNGATYYYVVSAENTGGDGPDSAEVSATLLHLLPFAENFEALSLGDLAGQNLWASSNAVVQTNITFAGAKAAAITSEIGFIEQTFAGSESNVWTDVRIQPVFCAETPAAFDPTATAVFFFNTNGNPVVFNSTNVQVVSSVTVSTGDWVRVTVYTDYTTKKWDFYIDGAPVASGLDFYDAANTRYERLQFSGGGPSGAFLDDITVGTSSPFAGLPLFTVISAHGSPSPAVGTWSYELDSEINAYMPDAIITNGLIRYVCTGWIGTGSALTSGADTNFTFTITEDTTITWQWQTNYWVNLEVATE